MYLCVLHIFTNIQLYTFADSAHAAQVKEAKDVALRLAKEKAEREEQERQQEAEYERVKREREEIEQRERVYREERDKLLAEKASMEQRERQRQLEISAIVKVWTRMHMKMLLCSSLVDSGWLTCASRCFAFDLDMYVYA